MKRNYNVVSTLNWIRPVQYVKFNIISTKGHYFVITLQSPSRVISLVVSEGSSQFSRVCWRVCVWWDVTGVMSLTFCGRWTTAVSDVTNPRVVSADKMPRFQGIFALNNSCGIGSSYISIWNFFQIGTSFCCNDKPTIHWMDYYYGCA